MQNAYQSEVPLKIASFNGVEIYNIKTRKFKTNSINIFFVDDLNKDTASKNALLASVLKRGCEGLVTFKDISLYLEELYGASFDCGVTKKGEQQIVQFYIDYISDEYAGEGSNLFEKAFELLINIITKPVIVDNAFSTKYVEQEKENLIKLIESRVNDKMQYSVDRCFEEMCKNEPYGISESGSVEAVNAINAQELYQHYNYFVESLPMYVFISGNLEEDKIKKAIEGLSKIKRSNVKNVHKCSSDNTMTEVKNISEKMDVNQGKLVMGFRTNTCSNQDDYYSLVVYNNILGGGMHSKLFQNVREKESLAYYIYSRLEKFKGLMVISGGIESENKDKAQKIIFKQIEEISDGNISKYEFESSIKTIETAMMSLLDSQFRIVDFYFGQVLANSDDTIESLVVKIKDVSKQDIVNVSNRIKLDTVYFLTK